MMDHSASTMAWYSCESFWGAFVSLLLLKGGRRRERERTTYRNMFDPDLSIIPLRLQLQLHIQTKHFGVQNLLRLLFKARITESLLKRHTSDQQTFLHPSSRDFLDPDQGGVEGGGVEGLDGVDDHAGEEGLGGVD